MREAILADNDKLEGMQYEAFKKMEKYDNLLVLSPHFEDDTLINKFRDACNQVLYEKADADAQAQEIYETFASSLKS